MIERLTIRRREMIWGMSALGGGLFFAVTSHSVRAAETIKFRDLYRTEVEFSQLALELAGKPITVVGFMAPPLKAEANFFVLTKLPMSVCPFCETEAEWPDSLIVVYTARTLSVVPWNLPIEVTGTLSLGTETDEETGFVSRVRLLDAKYRKMT